jgi:KipI family sensor histidine kinase inhibitor
MIEFKIKPMGDTCVTVLFKQEIKEDINADARGFCKAVKALSADGIIDAVPSYSAAAVFYDPIKLPYDNIKGICEDILTKGLGTETSSGRVFEIPVCYGGEYGPDLDIVASVNSLSHEDVVNIHTSRAYLIYMLGFAPGFCYLGGLDESIAAPRKDVPRQKITPGSVGIAGTQTGMYPIESPGGWQLIGRTPLTLYDPHREPPVYYNSGDYIKYKAVSEAEYNEISAQVARGEYNWVIKDYIKEGRA